MLGSAPQGSAGAGPDQEDEMAKGTEKTQKPGVTNAQPGAAKGGKPATPDAGKAGAKIGQAEVPRGGKTK